MTEIASFLNMLNKLKIATFFCHTEVICTWWNVISLKNTSVCAWLRKFSKRCRRILIKNYDINYKCTSTYAIFKKLLSDSWLTTFWYLQNGNSIWWENLDGYFAPDGIVTLLVWYWWGAIVIMLEETGWEQEAGVGWPWWVDGS